MFLKIFTGDLVDPRADGVKSWETVGGNYDRKKIPAENSFDAY